MLKKLYWGQETLSYTSALVSFAFCRWKKNTGLTLSFYGDLTLLLDNEGYL